MGVARSRVLAVLAAAAAVTLSGCGLVSASAPTNGTAVATQPPGAGATGTVTPTPGASGSAAPQLSGQRTVLTPEGLRIHSSASLSASVEAAAAWGVTLTVLGYDASGGGWQDATMSGTAWYKVQGATVTGWVVADPTLSAEGVLTPVSFADKDIDGVLFPTTWTYADDPGEVVFRPQSGSDLASLAIRYAATLSALGAAGLTGYSAVASNDEAVACGYTGTLVQYTAGAGATPQPTADAGGAAVTRLADFAQFRVALSSSFALDIEINYSAAGDYTVFENVLNSVRYPFPDCETGTAGTAPSASPSPSPSPS
jgi:hypothetical protein